MAAPDSLVLPSVVTDQGEATARRFVDFFVVPHRNRNTRQAYARAAARWLAWCEAQGLALPELQPIHIAAYVEDLGAELSAATVKQHLAAIRQLCGWLVTGGVLPMNPTADVKGPRHVTTKGVTPVLLDGEARQLLESIDGSDVVGQRDRAVIGVMLYSFARVGAVVQMRVRDYQELGNRAVFALQEKGGKRKRVPAHHHASELVRSYIASAGIADDRDGPLFRAAPGRGGVLTDRPLHRRNVLGLVKRRAIAAGLSPDICNHSFRATGITNYMANAGSLETAASLAGHASTRTTQLYNRTAERIEQEEIERIRF